MKNKKHFLLIALLSISIFGIAQNKQIENGKYNLEINNKYDLVGKENNELHFVYFDKSGKFNILQRIGIKDSGINAKENNINTISDFANLETISIVSDNSYKKEDEISGMTKVENVEIFYVQKSIREFKNSQKTDLKEYNFITKYYFFINEKIYQIIYNADLMTSVMEKYNEYDVSKKMKKINNLNDLNLIIETLRIK